MINWPIIIFSFFIVLVSNAHAESYSKEDLKVLAEENNFNEFILHAQDIRPSQRDDWWKEQLRRMGKKFIEERIAKNDFSTDTHDKIESLYALPAIKEDEFVSTRREEYNRALIKNCFQFNNKMECYKTMNNFWESTKGSINRPEIALEIASLLDQYNIQTEKWKYFATITTGKTATFYCGRENIKQVVIQQLINKFSRVSDSSKFDQQTKEVANEDCIDKMILDLKQLLTSEDKVKAEMSYHLLLSRKKIDELESNAFLISFIMMGPVVGETFNQSWNMLEQLGKNYELRMKVLARLQQYDPLPDELVNSANKKKRDLLLDMMNKNFPEYVDFYARTCLDYLEGKKSFPNGNPTKYCRQFFQLSKNKEWPNSGLKMRYESLPKL